MAYVFKLEFITYHFTQVGKLFGTKILFSKSVIPPQTLDIIFTLAKEQANDQFHMVLALELRGWRWVGLKAAVLNRSGKFWGQSYVENILSHSQTIALCHNINTSSYSSLSLYSSSSSWSSWSSSPLPKPLWTASPSSLLKYNQPYDKNRINLVALIRST